MQDEYIWIVTDDIADDTNQSVTGQKGDWGAEVQQKVKQTLGTAMRVSAQVRNTISNTVSVMFCALTSARALVALSISHIESET